MTHNFKPILPEMVHIPPGPFPMGSSLQGVDQLAELYEWAAKWKDKGYFGREQPQHTLNLKAYAIGKYPIRGAEYLVFIQAGGYLSSQYWTASGWRWIQETQRAKPDYWEDPQWTGEASLPVVGVSWHEAYAYCRWLANITGKPYRLPSEAEWEKAAGGSEGRPYPWGREFDPSRCNTRTGALGQTSPMGKYSPAGDSSFGCADMVGNVSEWTQSLYKPYPYQPGGHHEDPDYEAERVTRGGSWHSPDFRARVQARGMNTMDFTDNDVGFRCAYSR